VDYEGDLLNGIRTSAVVFGCRRTFLASLFTFTAAYAILAGLAALRILQGCSSGALSCGFAVWWSLQTLQRGLGFRDRVMDAKTVSIAIAFIGLAMLAS